MQNIPSPQLSKVTAAWPRHLLIGAAASTWLMKVFFIYLFSFIHSFIYLLNDGLIWISADICDIFTHTNQHLELLSKYILFWTFVSFIWQKKEQMDVMNLQTNRRNTGRETFTQNAAPCDVTSSQSSYRRHKKTEIITVHLSDVTTVHLVCWATTLWHCYINDGVKKKNQSNSWIQQLDSTWNSSLVETE